MRRYGDLEAAGYLWTQHFVRSSSESLAVCLATHAGDAVHGKTSVELEHPLELQRSFPAAWSHMKLAGDFHSHVTRGSTVPSEADMRAWGGWVDRLGLARYIGLIVSPSPESGWMYGGRLSAWTVSRQGSPSRLVCEPARIAGE